MSIEEGDRWQAASSHFFAEWLKEQADGNVVITLSAPPQFLSSFAAIEENRALLVRKFSSTQCYAGFNSHQFYEKAIDELGKTWKQEKQKLINKATHLEKEIEKHRLSEEIEQLRKQEESDEESDKAII